MNKQAMLDVNPEQNAVLDQLHMALSKGDERGISQCIRDSIRCNPRLDQTEFLKRAMGNRTLTAFNRHYAASLMAVPLCGEIRRPLTEFGLSKDLMKTAKKQGLINGDDGIMILNAPLTRESIQQLSLHQLYMCVPRMFTRGTQQSNELIFDIEGLNAPQATADAMVLVLVYWREGTTKPLLLDDAKAQRKFGELMGNFLALERSDDGHAPKIWGRSLMPFFDASKAMAVSVAGRLADNLFREDLEYGYQSMRVTTELLDDGDGRYRLIAHRAIDGKASDLGFGMLTDELLDGSLVDLLTELENRCRQYDPKVEINRRFCTSRPSVDERGNVCIEAVDIVFN